LFHVYYLTDVPHATLGVPNNSHEICIIWHLRRGLLEEARCASDRGIGVGWSPTGSGSTISFWSGLLDSRTPRRTGRNTNAMALDLTLIRKAWLGN